MTIFKHPLPDTEMGAFSAAVEIARTKNVEFPSLNPANESALRCHRTADGWIRRKVRFKEANGEIDSVEVSLTLAQRKFRKAYRKELDSAFEDLWSALFRKKVAGHWRSHVTEGGHRLTLNIDVTLSGGFKNTILETDFVARFIKIGKEKKTKVYGLLTFDRTQIAKLCRSLIRKKGRSHRDFTNQDKRLLHDLLSKTIQRFWEVNGVTPSALTIPSMHAFEEVRGDITNLLRTSSGKPQDLAWCNVKAALQASLAQLGLKKIGHRTNEGQKADQKKFLLLFLDIMTQYQENRQCDN